MNYDKFVSIIKNLKYSTKHTGYSGIKVRTNREHTKQTVYTKLKCKTCGTNVTQNVTVYFKKPEQLTIFTADLLYFLFILKRKPMDYANYHKCIAGKEFIENIEKVEV